LNRHFGLVHFLLNNCLNLLTLYYLVYADVLYLRPLIRIVASVKPFFSVIVRTFMQFGELSLILTSLVHSLLYGAEVVQTLASPVFDSVWLYRSRAATGAIVAAFLLLNQFIMMITFSLQLSVWWAWPPTLNSILSI